MQKLHVFQGSVPHNMARLENWSIGMFTSGTKFIPPSFVNSQVSKPVEILKCGTDMQARARTQHADLKSLPVYEETYTKQF
jgi:hypothetical protein